MKYINTFKTHASYEAELNGGGVDISLPNISYCKDVKDVHYNPYNTVEFYVGEVATLPQTVSIYTDSSTSVDVTVSEGNKWYTYVLPKDKRLYKIESGTLNEDDSWSNGIVTKVVVKADINYSYDENNDTYNGIVPCETTEVSFKGSNTSNVTDMGYMFRECSALTSLDLSNFDTSNVTSMSSMFTNCNDITSLDLSNFNTSNVTNMNYMFGCNSLTSLDLSNFNTSNVTDIHGMFQNCTSLTSLDLKNFNTSNVIYIEQMFEGCASLTSLDLSNFNTSKVTSMNTMFQNCTSLTSLDLKNFNTSNVIYMSSMFNGCSSLAFLDLSGWDTSNVTDMSNMFDGCASLRTIRMIGCKKPTIDKIKAQLKADGLSENIVKQ